MFESQVEDYIGKVLVEEAKGEGKFLSESEIAFAVTGKMYADGVKSEGPVSLRSIKGKMPKVRQTCDEKGMLMLPRLSAKDNLADGENPYEVIGWAIIPHPHLGAENNAAEADNAPSDVPADEPSEV